MVLKIISAENIVFEGEAYSVSLPGEKGRFMVLPRHASLVSTLTAGSIVYKDASGEHTADVAGGIVDIHNDVVSVCIY